MLTKAEAGNLELRLGLLMWVTGTQVCHLLPFQDAHEPEVSEAEKPGLEPGPPTWDAEPTYRMPTLPRTFYYYYYF